MNVRCPACSTLYRVDPRKVPGGGVHARCSTCQDVFLVASSLPAAVPPTPDDGRVASTAPPANPFSASDPLGKARRLARALVSDIAVYHPERRDHSLADGTLRQEFREEIRKSWEEYVAQVGDDLARSTPHFRDALNEILARGERLF